MKEKVSVIIPAYNSAAYIKQTLQSIVNQTYNNIEVIVVNDGSKDETSSVAGLFLADKGIDYQIVEKNNGGQASARNFGIKHAKGDFVMFLDSDDFIAINYIERMLTALRNNNADFAACPFQNVYVSDFERIPQYDNGDSIYDTMELSQRYLHRKICLLAPALLIKRDVLDIISFEESCPYDEDGLFVWSLLFNTQKGVYCDIPMYNYRVREGSIMHSLTAEKCHQSILSYTKYCKLFVEKRNDKLSQMILPNYKLSSQHVLAKNVIYKDFLYEYNRTDKSDIKKLLSLKDIKLTLLALSYLVAPRFYYMLCKRF